MTAERLSGSERPLIERYRAFLLDLDGVVYRGSKSVPHAVDVLNETRRRGLRQLFVTNNASWTPHEVAALLSRLGLPTTDQDIVTSVQVAAGLAASYLAKRLRPGAYAIWAYSVKPNLANSPRKRANARARVGPMLPSGMARAVETSR